MPLLQLLKHRSSKRKRKIVRPRKQQSRLKRQPQQMTMKMTWPFLTKLLRKIVLVEQMDVKRKSREPITVSVVNVAKLSAHLMFSHVITTVTTLTIRCQLRVIILLAWQIGLVKLQLQ